LSYISETKYLVNKNDVSNETEILNFIITDSYDRHSNHFIKKASETPIRRFRLQQLIDEDIFNIKLEILKLLYPDK